jgi:GNAT superfamily N-acetyltransferase
MIAPVVMESPAIASPLRFESFRAEFLEPMLALHRSAVEGLVLGRSREREEADLVAVEHHYLRGSGEFLLGFSGNRLVAMGAYKRTGPDSAELRRMCTAPDCRSRGHGSRMLRELEQRAADAGIQCLRIEAPLARPFTLAFYRKRGYQEVGRSHYGNIETVQFQKLLPA